MVSPRPEILDPTVAPRLVTLASFAVTISKRHVGSAV